MVSTVPQIIPSISSMKTQKNYNKYLDIICENWCPFVAKKTAISSSTALAKEDRHFAISTRMRRSQKPKIPILKNFYPLLSQALIDLDPPRHFAISTKKRRFARNTEGVCVLKTGYKALNERPMNQIRHTKETTKLETETSGLKSQYSGL